MPPTKQKPEPRPTVLTATGTNGPASAVFTLAEAAAYLRLSEQDVLGMIHEQGLPARRAGAEWRFLKTAIDWWLSGGSPSLPSTNEAWLAMAGKYRNDPDLEQIVEDAYRRRGRPITEDGSYKNFSR
jgi:excisionase family DNA binding protein